LHDQWQICHCRGGAEAATLASSSAQVARRKVAFMTLTSPRSTALLVVDPLNDFISEQGKLWPHLREVAERLDTVANMRRLLGWARAHALRVFFVPHHRAEPGDYEGWRFLNPTQQAAKRLQPFARGSWGGDFHPAFQPLPGEVIVHEHWLHSGFANTDLDVRLRTLGIDHLVLAGLRGNTCIEGTARHAVELGYHVTIVKDAIATFKHQEWIATVEINAPTFAHAIVATADLVNQ
jgi:nicotinamidase-related amidase